MQSDTNLGYTKAMEHAKSQCNCIVHHANTPEHRAQVTKQMEYFRRIGDRQGTMITMMQLAGPCPTRPTSANH